jgi:hypothetical protein
MMGIRGVLLSVSSLQSILNFAYRMILKLLISGTAKPGAQPNVPSQSGIDNILLLCLNRNIGAPGARGAKPQNVGLCSDR